MNSVDWGVGSELISKDTLDDISEEDVGETSEVNSDEERVLVTSGSVDAGDSPLPSNSEVDQTDGLEPLPSVISDTLKVTNDVSLNPSFVPSLNINSELRLDKSDIEVKWGWSDDDPELSNSDVYICTP